MKTLFRGWPVMAHETHTRRSVLSTTGVCTIATPTYCVFGYTVNIVLAGISCSASRSCVCLIFHFIQSCDNFLNNLYRPICQSIPQAIQVPHRCLNSVFKSKCIKLCVSHNIVNRVTQKVRWLVWLLTSLTL